MNSPKGVIFGVAAAVLGAALWAGIALAIGREFAWLAIGVGALIGAAMKAGESRGPVEGGVAAALAVVAICAGKLAIVTLSLSSAIEERANEQFTRAEYEVIVAQVEDYKTVETDDELRRFITNFGYADTTNPDAVTEDEVDHFLANMEPGLLAYGRDMPDFEKWRADAVDRLERWYAAHFGTWERLKASIGVIDVVFFLFAVAAAYQLVAREE